MSSSPNTTASDLVRGLEDQLEHDLERADQLTSKLLKLEEHNASLHTQLREALEAARTHEGAIGDHEKTIRDIRKKLWSLNISTKKTEKQRLSITAKFDTSQSREDALLSSIEEAQLQTRTAQHHNQELRTYAQNLRALCAQNLQTLQTELSKAHASFEHAKANIQTTQTYQEALAERIRHFSFLLTTISDDVQEAALSLEHRQTLIDLPDPPTPTPTPKSLPTPTLPKHPSSLLSEDEQLHAQTTTAYEPTPQPTPPSAEPEPPETTTPEPSETTTPEPPDPIEPTTSETPTPKDPTPLPSPNDEHNEPEPSPEPEPPADPEPTPQQDPPTPTTPHLQTASTPASNTPPTPKDPKPQTTDPPNTSSPNPDTLTEDTEPTPQSASSNEDPHNDRAQKKRSKRLAEARARRRKKRKSKKKS